MMQMMTKKLRPRLRSFPLMNISGRRYDLVQSVVRTIIMDSRTQMLRIQCLNTRFYIILMKR